MWPLNFRQSLGVAILACGAALILFVGGPNSQKVGIALVVCGGLVTSIEQRPRITLVIDKTRLLKALAIGVICSIPVIFWPCGPRIKEGAAIIIMGAIFILGIPWNITAFFALLPLTEILLGSISFPCIESGGAGWANFGKAVFVSQAIGMFINISLIAYVYLGRQKSDA